MYREYRPQIEEEFAEVLATILKPTWWHERRQQPFTDLLTQWDELIGEYIMHTGETLFERSRIATMISHAPEDVRRFVHTLPMSTKHDYVALRRAVRDHVLGASTVSRIPTDFSMNGPTPMEVDALSGETRSCRNCNKPGHLA